MINIIIPYDNEDYELGEYFEHSYHNIVNYISTDRSLSIIPIVGLDCVEDNINNIVATVNNKNFIFIGLSHGNERELLANETFVSTANAHAFVNSFFYTTACCTAQQLSSILLSHNCICYIGCDNNSYATYEEFYSTYSDCENYCIKEFLSTDKSIDITFLEMQLYFDTEINKLFDKNEVLVAMELQQNKDCMVKFGNSNLTRKDFTY